MDMACLTDNRGLRAYSSDFEDERPEPKESTMSQHLRIGDFIPSPDFSRFSDEQVELLQKMIEFEGICPEAEWMVALKANFLNEGLVFNGKLYHFHEKEIILVEDFDEIEAFTRYGNNTTTEDNEDHRGLDRYDNQWMHDKKIQITDMIITKHAIHLLMPGHNARKYDVIYLNPWPFNENGYEVIDYEEDGWLTIDTSIMADLDFVSQDENGDSEPEHAKKALLEQYKISGVIYKLNRQPNIDFRGSDYDGPDEKPAGAYGEDEDCFSLEEILT